MKSYLEVGRKPTLEEFRNYIESKGFDINPYELYAEFESRNWTTKKGNPMKSWTALVDARNGIICQKKRALVSMRTSKLFRLHRGSLNESMKTCKEVNSLKDIEEYFKSQTDLFFEYFVNFQIDSRGVDDSIRLGASWSDTHYVLADCIYPGHEFKAQCIGMCNFHEEGIVK